MHSPCIFVQLPPVIGSYKSGEHSGVGASHGGVDPLGEKGLGGVTDFFSMKGWQIISAARWRHELILPIFQVLALKKNKTKRKQMKRKASLPMSLDSVLVLIILNIIDNHITKHNQHDLPPRSPRFRSRGSHPWWNPSPKHVPQEEKENELEGHIRPVTTLVHHLEFTDIKFWCTSRNKPSNMHLVMNTSLSNAACTTKPHKSWENSHQHLDEIRSRPATTRTSAWKHPPIRRSP